MKWILSAHARARLFERFQIRNQADLYDVVYKIAKSKDLHHKPDGTEVRHIEYCGLRILAIVDPLINKIITVKPTGKTTDMLELRGVDYQTKAKKSKSIECEVEA